MLEIVDCSFFVVVFVAVRLVGGDFPGCRVEIQIELGQLFLDSDLLKFRLRWDFVTKRNSIIKNAKLDGHDTFVVFVFGQIESRFVIVVVDVAVFTPRELDTFSMFFLLLTDES